MEGKTAKEINMATTPWDYLFQRKTQELEMGARAAQKEVFKQVRQELSRIKKETPQSKLKAIVSDKGSLDGMLSGIFTEERIRTLLSTRSYVNDYWEGIVSDLLRYAAGVVASKEPFSGAFDYSLKVAVSCQCPNCTELERRLPEKFETYGNKKARARPADWFISWFPFYVEKTTLPIKKGLSIDDLVQLRLVSDTVLEKSPGKSPYLPQLPPEHLDKNGNAQFVIESTVHVISYPNGQLLVRLKSDLPQLGKRTAWITGWRKDETTDTAGCRFVYDPPQEMFARFLSMGGNEINYLNEISVRSHRMSKADIRKYHLIFSENPVLYELLVSKTVCEDEPTGRPGENKFNFMEVVFPFKPDPRHKGNLISAQFYSSAIEGLEENLKSIHGRRAYRAIQTERSFNEWSALEWEVYGILGGCLLSQSDIPRIRRIHDAFAAYAYERANSQKNKHSTKGL